MAKEKTKYELAKEQVESAIQNANNAIESLGSYTSDLYSKLNDIQGLFDQIRGIPSEQKVQYEKTKKVNLAWKQQAESIEKSYQDAKIKSAGSGTAGVGAGVAVAALGPTAAMGIATTFGVASTGTAISALSGAAATNAALAWLGGGALAVGGGGMVAGEALLAMAGPVGWAIAGAALIGSSIALLVANKDKKNLEGIFTLISERDAKRYQLATVELNERIKRIKGETHLLSDAIEKIPSFGLDYCQMTEAQQYELGSYVNLMEASTRLLVDPIKGLQPKYSEIDFGRYLSMNLNKGKTDELSYLTTHKELLITMANLVYAIPLEEKDKKLLIGFLKKSKDFMNTVKLKKTDVEVSVFEYVDRCLEAKYAQ